MSKISSVRFLLFVAWNARSVVFLPIFVSPLFFSVHTCVVSIASGNCNHSSLSLLVVVSMHQCCIKCWQVLFLLIFLTQRHLWDVRLYASLWILLFAGPFVGVPLWCPLRMVLTLLRGTQTTMSNSSIWLIDRALSAATSPGQGWPRSNGSKGVLRIPQSPNIADTSSPDCLVSLSGYSLWEFYPSSERSRWILLPQPAGQNRVDLNINFLNTGVSPDV